VKLYILFGLGLLLVILPGVGTGQENLAETVDGTVAVARETQAAKDQWAREKATLMSRYRSATANAAHLGARRDVAAAQLEALESEVSELERRLIESSRLQECLAETLRAILTRFEVVVARDLPFLAAERELRITSLKNEMNRSDVSAPEKLRRLLEAMQVEAQYGGEVELYQERIAVDSDSLYVDLLRVGRLAAFWRTPDGERVGQYDIATACWRELPGKYKGPISEAMEMAVRQRPYDLIALPLGRINP
jgi:Protein of unknown function (DUF3450)